MGLLTVGLVPAAEALHSTQTSTVLWWTSSSTSTIFPCSPSWIMPVMLSQSRSASFISGEKGLGHLHGQTSGLLLSELGVPIGAQPRWRRVVRMSARRS
jgi:hypothetical protein